jgi:hypothetical protein
MDTLDEANGSGRDGKFLHGDVRRAKETATAGERRRHADLVPVDPAGSAGRRRRSR